MIFFPILTFSLPDSIDIDYKTKFSMEYNLDQTFNQHEDPNNYKDARTTIEYDIDFNIKRDWVTSVEYDVKIRYDTCGDLNRYDFDFGYLMTNTSRDIDTLYYSYDDWPIEEKHPTFYSGTNPNTYELFLLDELMLLRGESGIIEKSLKLEGIEEIKISNNEYKVYDFKINITIDDGYYR